MSAHFIPSDCSDRNRQTTRIGTIKTNAIADRAIIERTSEMSPTKIIASPKAAKIAPQTVRMRGDGFSSPPVPIMARVKPALTTLVMTKRKAARIVAAWVKLLSGNCCNSAKVVASRLLSLTSNSEPFPRKTSKKPSPCRGWRQSRAASQHL